MAEFDWPSASGSSTQHRPRVTVVKFGDGYEQRRANGLNHQLRTWPRVLQGMEPVVAQGILQFLRARGGVEAFDWISDSGEKVRVVCDQWDATDRRRGGVWRVDINAVFREVVA